MKQTELNVTDAERVTVWVLTDNYFDATRPDTEYAVRYRSSPGKCIHAEHGLAFFIETESGGRRGACMFDFGMDPDGLDNNMRLLGIDIGKADAFGLSHGHYDHFMGAAETLKKNRALIKDGTPFYVGKEAFLNRYSLRQGAQIATDIGMLDQTEIEASGISIREVVNPIEIIPGGYISGDIERITPYETPSPSLLVKRGDSLVPDDFRGEQALLINIKGRGLVIISGCAHAGIVNTVKHVQKITGIKKVHAILGGFHLVNAKEDKIRDTIADIKMINPDIIAPLHCTGFEAVAAFMNAMPDAFILNTAGTQYKFGS
ncbi:MAG: MBL fold metallo-hydrolase [Desulfatiglans sp.]|jgi:7,8-dihydropterin-6-yl-methyl-4-(beta-D-ribofuranosyl)aminobenzene 5'-phosphate synthase|nr:MBL fold metallo-hydrolase [Desulfatiglans sp.]